MHLLSVQAGLVPNSYIGMGNGGTGCFSTGAGVTLGKHQLLTSAVLALPGMLLYLPISSVSAQVSASAFATLMLADTTMQPLPVRTCLRQVSPAKHLSPAICLWAVITLLYLQPSKIAQNCLTVVFTTSQQWGDQAKDAVPASIRTVHVPRSSTPESLAIEACTFNISCMFKSETACCAMPLIHNQACLAMQFRL